VDKTQDTLDRCAAQARRAFPDGPAPCSARDAALYLAHVEQGESLRALAQVAGTHPSTVLRAVRRVEARRDDPLFDRLIEGIDREAGSAPEAKAAVPDHRFALPGARGGQDGPAVPCRAASDDRTPAGGPEADDAREAEVRRAAKTALRRLSEPGAFLLLAPGTDRGGIFCAANQHRKPIAMVQVAMAAEFLRRDWLRVLAQGVTTVRYQVTEVGRAALRRILAEDLAARDAPGFAEAQSPFAFQHQATGPRILPDPETGDLAQAQVNLGESPLGWLARRRGPDGNPFLGADEVEAGERLRQDFEMAQMGPRLAQDWGRFLTPAGPRGRVPDAPGGDGAARARERVNAAVAALGPGLGDVVLRVCCFLEGLEACERRMGWSARSGKVVLKIALQRLSEHHGLTSFRH
jgi:hypothetical protein